MGATTSVDQLQIDIQAQSTRANDALDRLVAKLDKLSTSLGKIDGSRITGLANGVSKLGSAMQGMNNIKTADFTRLASNLQKLGNINVSALNSSASSISLLSKSFNNLGTVSQNAQAVGEMAKNISKLGNKGVQQAIANIPNLATAMKNLMQTLSTAPNVSQNIIQMTNALANLTSQGSKVGTMSNSLFGGLNRTGSAMTRATKNTFSLSSAIGKFYQTYYLVIRGIKKSWESIEGTADYIEAYNYYNVAFGKIASEWKQDFKKFGYENAESYVESFTNRMNQTLGKMSGVQINTDTGILEETGFKNLGLNIKEITQYASQLASVTNSVGQTGEVSLATASSFSKLAGDISSLFNLDYSTVATNLQSGLIGQSRALYKYGIDITNATLQTYAYELGLSKAVSEMTQAEKMQLRMIAILEQSKVSWGDLANTINSPSNMIRQFKNNVSELASVFGQLFIPVLQKVLPVINGASIALKRLLANIAGFLGIEIDLSSFGQGYTDIEDGLGDIEDGLDGVTNAAKKANKSLQPFDELSNLTSSDSSSGASGGSGIDLTDEILKATEEYEKVWAEAYKKMESKAQKFADKISQYLEPLKKLFKDISIGDWFAVGQDTSNIVSGIFNFFSDAIADVEWEKIGNNTGEFISGLDWYDIVTSAIELSWNTGMGLTDFFIGLFNELDEEKFADGIIDGIKKTDWKKVIKEFFKGVFKIDELFDEMGFFKTSPALKDISIIIDIFEKVHEVDWKKLKEDTKKAWGDFTLTVKMTAENIKQKVSEKWSELVEWWNSKPNLKDVELNPSDLLGSIAKLWRQVREWWDNKPKLVDVEFSLSDLKTKISTIWNDVQKFWNSKPKLSQISTTVFDILQLLKDAWNRAKNWWNSNVKLSIPKLDFKVVYKKASGIVQQAVVSALNLEGWPSFQFFAQGGFPEDGWFRANHGEIMGKFDNGKSVVANNKQITDGISAAVYQGNQESNALLREEIALLQRQNELLLGILDKEFGITQDEIGKSARKWAKDYYNRTGNEAYSF